MNAVVIAVLLMVGLSLARVNIVIALVISALVGGVVGGLPLVETVSVFTQGLGGGAAIALNYAMLGAFAVTISRSGITDVLAEKVIKQLTKKDATAEELKSSTLWVKCILFSVILLAAIFSQNLVPVHIAFIPILIPPLLHMMMQLQLDRRAIACLLTFGLTATYMLLPVGFGKIFLNTLLFNNLVENGAEISVDQLPFVMAIPVFGMFLGLLVALFISYRKPRTYSLSDLLAVEPEKNEIQVKHLWVALLAIVSALVVQLYSDSVIIGSLSGLLVFIAGGVLKVEETQDVFAKGVYMMGVFGFIMISAAGFAEVMKATQAIDSLVYTTTELVGDNKLLAATLMLLTGLLVTMGIGSSFSTIPIIASIYVPLALGFGFSPLATAALVGTAAALGDAGSPASDSTLGPTSGLNVDGQHDHIWDTVVPTFIHYNIPLIVFGVIAALVL
ncbi:MAG: Na+/H+ antiporter family protein [Gammaproteobacteria bacterium]|nr:Na+/H+ antiporter family protein [Gammaproteobacteria bacterium]